ncbi:MAG: tRNA dihydrouridine synthase DusB [Spirochaetaceae bacterium]|jgi:nifR3 family TIM-barrel protein|nr:tRNA dihydrouridine synthase DusB [Spirochaetaceae bacterium]
MRDLYHPVSIGNLETPGNLFLAPVAGYTDRAFRSICVEQGANFTYTELVSAEAMVRGGPSFSGLLGRADNEIRYGVQLFGSDPETIYKAAVLLEPFAPDLLDLNAGCPVPKVVKTGAGAGLMRNPPGLGRVIGAANRASMERLGRIPVTVKLRSGWDADSINYRECSQIAVEAGAAAVTLHPRTREQGYTGKSDWRYIQDLVSRLPVPVIGSGDLFSPQAAEEMLRETACAAVMFARGALGNPFIFSETFFRLQGSTLHSEDPRSSKQILETGFRHLLLRAGDAGEKKACLEMRKQMCAYTRGISGGGALRNKLVHAESIADYRRILDEYLATFSAPPS